MSKYNEITTAKDLIREAISNGMSTVQEDINRAADIFGNTSVGELANLANSEESISGKRVGEMFYFIAFNIWNWREATAFYNEHTNPATQAAKQTADELRKTKEKLETLSNNYEKLIETNENHRKLADELGEERMDLINSNDEMKRTITELKAKLYDLMTAGA